MKRNALLLVFPLFVFILCGCGMQSDGTVVVPGGDPARGQAALLSYGCEACHTIPGVYGTQATVGPPLAQFTSKRLIAGELVNTPDNVIKWIMDPQSIEPGNAMPNLNVSAGAARDIAAYLYTLH